MQQRSWVAATVNLSLICILSSRNENRLQLVKCQRDPETSAATLPLSISYLQISEERLSSVQLGITSFRSSYVVLYPNLILKGFFLRFFRKTDLPLSVIV